MSTLVTMPYKKWGPFTELWLCNPALGLPDPERVPEQPEGSPEAPVEGCHNWPLFKRGSQFWALLRAPRSRILLPGVEGLIPQLRRPNLLPGVQPFLQTSDVVVFYPLRFKFNIISIAFQRTGLTAQQISFVTFSMILCGPLHAKSNTL
jgi:hypothetical protein